MENATALTGGTFSVPQSELNSAKPSTLFVYFLLHRWNEFLNDIKVPEKYPVDILVSSLFSTCIDKERRKQFQNDYVAMKAEFGETTAAILVSGDFFGYIAEISEFVDVAYGGSA